eukprot:scaffold19769_cov63-Phaeocystis_antarctica.AAC.8
MGPRVKSTTASYVMTAPGRGVSQSWMQGQASAESRSAARAWKSVPRVGYADIGRLLRAQASCRTVCLGAQQCHGAS